MQRYNKICIPANFFCGMLNVECLFAQNRANFIFLHLAFMYARAGGDDLYNYQ